jgi:hypothetical protein
VAAEPPVLAGSVKLTVALPLPLVTATPVGASGSVELGVTGEDAIEELPAPLPFVAVTV